MALDTTVSGSSANSYVSVADADTYFTGHLDSSMWTGLDTNGKEYLLKAAAQYLESIDYAGDVTVPEQALSFPRTNIYRRGDLRTPYPSDSIPTEIKNAQCEVCLFLLKSHDAQEYSSISLAGVSITRFSSIMSLYVTIRRNLEPFLKTKSMGILRLSREQLPDIRGCYGTRYHY